MSYPAKDEVYALASSVGIPPIQMFGFVGTYGRLPMDGGMGQVELDSYRRSVWQWAANTGWPAEFGFGFGQSEPPGPTKDPTNGLPRNEKALIDYAAKVGDSSGRMGIYPPVSQGYPPGSYFTSTLDSTGPHSNPNPGAQEKALAGLRAALAQANASVTQTFTSAPGTPRAAAAAAAASTGGVAAWIQHNPITLGLGLLGLYLVAGRRR